MLFNGYWRHQLRISIGIFRFDLVAWICGGQDAIIARIVYTLVGIAALWCVSLLFRDRDSVRD